MPAALHVGYSDIQGGASRAMIRLHRALVAAGAGSRVLVQHKCGDDPRVVGPAGSLATGLALLRPYLGKQLLRLQPQAGATLHNAAWLPGGLGTTIRQLGPAVVNLHWLGGETLTVAEIGRIAQPLVWTLHDMWPFCGTEHYAPDQDTARWREGYRRDNRDAAAGGLDLERWTWRRKLRHWQRPITLIAPTHWLAGCVRSSALMHDWPVHVIPNPLDTTRFTPVARELARHLLGIPQERPVIMFTAMGGSRDPRKGFDLLQQALLRLREQRPSGDILCVILGQEQPAQPPDIGFPALWLGQLHDDAALALAYNAADVTVVPSRLDNLPQTGTEAQACGCPVVAFDIGGLPDIVEHELTGYLAPPFDAEGLARGIAWVLEDPARRDRLAAGARARAVRLWSYDTIVPRYLDVYRSLTRL
jgi:glycosyltransferase involved in cell wall biosynthesis